MPDDIKTTPLLVTRLEASKMLAVSLRSLIRLEAEGRLQPIRLSDSHGSVVRFEYANFEVDRASQTQVNTKPHT